MEKNELGQESYTRREFLRAAQGAGAFGALAILIGGSTPVETAALPADPADAPAGGGYRETEHIRKYYRCAGYW